MKTACTGAGAWLVVLTLLSTSCRCGTGRHDASHRVVSPVEGCRTGTEQVVGEWESVQVDGRERHFILDAPVNDPGEMLPVVLSFHGIGADPESLRRYTGMGEEAQRRRFIAVHPAGEFVRLGPRFGPGWSIDADGNREVRLVEEILRWLGSRYCIDPDGIYATGFSNGGHLVHVLACKLPGRIAGIAAVGGALRNMGDGCGSPEPLSVMIVHGRADPVVDVDEGRAAAEFWKEEDGCGGERVGDVCSRWQGCKEDVVYCEIPGLRHSWPRKDAGDGVDATSEILDFFGLTAP